MTIAMGKNTDQRVGILARLFPKRMDERICSECGKPTLDHPDQVPARRFSKGNTEAFLYKYKTRSRVEYKLRVGVWHPGLHSSQLAQLFSEEDLVDLGYVLTEAIEFVTGCEKVVVQRATAKMSSR